MDVKWSRRLLGLVAVALAASACAGGDEAETKQTTFSYANSEPDSLIPGDTTSAYSAHVIDALFDRLVRLDPKTGEPIMNAAASVESQDQKVWTIKVRPGQTFHNGEPVTAQSFVDAWNAGAYGPNGWAANYYFDKFDGYADLNPEDENAKPRTDKLNGLTVIDDTTFEVTLGRPFSQFPVMLAFPAFAPMPKAAFTDLKAYNEAPIGNGPFMMDGTWERNKQVKVRKFADYRGQRPASVDGIVYRSYPRRDTQYTDLRAGKVDFVGTITAAKVPEAKRVLGDRFIDTPDSTMDYLAFPLYDRRFGNPDLRKAISMAIDRQAIVSAVFNGTYKPANSIFPELLPGHRDSGPCGEACTYDPRQAKALFDRAGGWDGTMYLTFSTADPSYEQWMTAVANQLKQNLGIQDIKFQKLPVSDYLTVLGDHQAKGPYRQNWYMDYPSPENYLTGLWGTDNRMAWENKRFAELVDKGNAAATVAESLPFYQQAEDVVLAELPATPLWNWRGQAGYSRNITDVTVNPYTGLVEISAVTIA